MSHEPQPGGKWPSFYVWKCWVVSPCPICSMYGIFTYIWVIIRANVGKYTIHGAYGCCQLVKSQFLAIVAWPKLGETEIPRDGHPSEALLPYLLGSLFPKAKNGVTRSVLRSAWGLIIILPRKINTIWGHPLSLFIYYHNWWIWEWFWCKISILTCRSSEM
jgi:hypothetical protein